MAYNRPYNPDALPRFAEPDAQHPEASKSRYESKPPPPVPQYAMTSPPPQSSSGRVASHGRHHQHQSGSRPPPSPATDGPSGSDPTLLPLFRAVDKDGTGQLSERELSTALVNGDWTAFDIQTVRMMIRMFDSDRNGTINFDEFCGLWSFLASWRTLFDRFDVDRSGNISLNEFTDALIAFRYRLSPHFVELLFRTYDKRNEGVMSFDLFVQSCISLKRMTDVFKKYDDDRDGYITLSFEDFLSEILKQLR
ncbi:hypothetical protein L249_6782 [Ophiocordyceps polyrhachis-furcata BCC 54312]|uniref:EF-hand domain-containing protein n=1 Tax=Ophiocordyceps polyrhachis-furcata BCC 54312 TaxID=1330021 RepID=A0A367LJR6_9HYPO|nr:hypothetical protein L249_6782 [Ophiocordyceps polyrhachis-furcata BCC 54312]